MSNHFASWLALVPRSTNHLTALVGTRKHVGRPVLLVHVRTGGLPIQTPSIHEGGKGRSSEKAVRQTAAKMRANMLLKTVKSERE